MEGFGGPRGVVGVLRGVWGGRGILGGFGESPGGLRVVQQGIMKL